MKGGRVFGEAQQRVEARATPLGRAGLIRNPLSRRNRNGRARTEGPDDVLRAEPESREALNEALADFARREVGLIVIDGGDGTVREVLSALPAAYGAAPPLLAVLASGTTNLIAADVGAGRADPATVQMLAQIARVGAPATSLQRRSTLEVSWPGSDREPVHGMFLGAAGFTRGTELSVTLVRQGKIDQGAGVAATLMAALAQTFAGAEREAWLRGEAMALRTEGGAWSEGDRFVFLATTLHKLMLGVWPFWGEAGEPEAGCIRYLDVAAPPKRLAAALPAVLRGRPRPWMTEAGYRSGATTGLDLRLQGPLVIDGETFEPGADGLARLRPGLALDFLVL